MSHTPQQGGATVRAHGLIPSTDLASLVAFLVEALPPQPDPKRVFSWPAITFDADNRRLVLNTYGVLRRLVAMRKFRDRFKQSDESGFLRDIQLPPKGFTAKTGGKILKDNFKAVSDSVTVLKKALAQELEQLGIRPGELLISNAPEVLAKFASELGTRDFDQPLPARLVPIEFAKSDRPVSAREQDVARVISAEEDIQAEDWLERMALAIAQAQASRDEEFDDSQRDKLIETLRQDARKSDSQVTRFLNFLEDEALARVRLEVSFAIMEALAVQVGNRQDADELAFVNYVRRVITLFKLYGTPEAEDSLGLDLSRDYGLHAEFTVSGEWVKAMFYNCLPVWAEWNAQLFESRRVDPASGGVSIVREVSYRFRVNGHDPKNEQLHAFDSRLTRQRQLLVDEVDELTPNPYRLRRNLAEVVFLWLVLNPDLAKQDLQHAAEELTRRLSRDGKAGVEQVLQELGGWSEQVIRLSKTLVALLRSKSRKVIAHAQRAIDDLYVVVQESIVDWVAIERSHGKAREPLVKPGDGTAEHVEWFKHVKIARKPEAVPGNLFSVRVRTALKERMLAKGEGDPHSMQTVRELPAELLNICWLPIRVDKQQSPHRAVFRTSISPVWQMGAGIDIWYEPELLKLRDKPRLPKKDDPTEEDRRQYRAATATALTLLVYIFLQLIAERCTKARDTRLATLMLRFQTQGRGAASTEGDPLIYAAAQAIEAALMRDVPIKMQGAVLHRHKHNTETLKYKRRGTAYALASAFPLVIGMPSAPSIPKVAVIIYATRPCDDHPDIGDADGYVFRAKTYRAEAVAKPFPGYRLQFDRMQTYVVESKNDFRSPKLIVEEVSRLQGQGCDHIILIFNHYGARHLNRSAQRHSPHTQTVFLEEVATKFADVNLYTLCRDVFPATRLHQRSKGESAFEVLRLTDHQEFALPQGNDQLKQLLPVYTFATLAIVGNDDVARPQSGFCTYFLYTDYKVQNLEWRERVRSNLTGANPAVRDCLLTVLRGLHFLEAEKVPPKAELFQPVLDPFGWVTPSSSEAAGEIEVISPSRRKGGILLSLPALLSHVTDALHRGRG